MTISNKSPNLSGALRRFHTKGVRFDIATLDDVFDFAIRNGGLEELDYIRDPEVSFNPRPARIAMIVLQSAKLNSQEAVEAALLSSVWPSDKEIENPPESLSENVLEIAARARLPPLTLIGSAKKEASNAEILACCLWLDRARHYHLAEMSRDMLCLDRFLQTTESYIELAQEVSAPLHTLLLMWLNRVGTQLRRKRRGKT